MVRHGIEIPREEISAFCQRHQIRRLALFGSVLRDDIGPDSDVDVLVVFDPAARVGLFRLMRIQSELSEMLGRNVDLNTPGFLSDRFREKALREAEDQYVAARSLRIAAGNAGLRSEGGAVLREEVPQRFGAR